MRADSAGRRAPSAGPVVRILFPPAASQANFRIAPLARPDLVERQPELLAHHLTAVGDIERAVTQWLKAGRHAAARSAYTEATEHFDRGLGLLPALSDPQERIRCEIELLLAKRGSLITIEEFASTNAGEAYRRAQLLTETRGDVEKLVIETL
jgi:predicted ATPase